MTAAGSIEPRKGITSYKQREGGPCFLSDMIIELGLAEEKHVNQAVEAARASGATVGQILVKDGRLSQNDLAHALAARYGLDHIDLNEFEVDPEAANLLPPVAAQRYKSVPLAFESDGSLLVAMADPSDSLALSDIAFMTHLEVHAAVAAADLIGDLASRLPLPPNESGRSRFPVAPPAPAPEPSAPDAAALEASDAERAAAQPSEPPVPPADSAELDSLRAELDELRAERDGLQEGLDAARAELERTTATLESERSEHVEALAQLREEAGAAANTGAELEATHAELDALRAELEGARSERDSARAELNTAYSERDLARQELEAARAERDAGHGELELACSERDAARSERDKSRDDLETARSELEAVRADLEQARREAEAANAEAVEQLAAVEQRAVDGERRAAELEQRLAELGDVERRVAEAHSTVEKMRHEFELEREGYAATERDLRARLASESERHEALQDAHAALQKRVEVLRTQNAALLNAYATAKRWSGEFARGARELAATLEQPVLDDAVRSQQASQDEPE